MLIKAWVKFDGMDIECICTQERLKKCGPEYGCEKYVVKFIPVEEEAKDIDFKKETQDLKKATKELEKGISKLTKATMKSILRR